jgi:hypothetical protein
MSAKFSAPACEDQHHDPNNKQPQTSIQIDIDPELTGVGCAFLVPNWLTNQFRNQLCGVRLSWTTFVRASHITAVSAATGVVP